MSLRQARKRRRHETTLEMTPLIDVVFLLLIFFLITTTFSKSREAEIPIDLPTAVTGETVTEGEKVVLFITDTGEVEVRGDVELAGDDFDAKLEGLYETDPEANIVLKGDQAASHGRVVEVLDRIKQVGFKRVNLVIVQPEAQATD